MDMKKGKDVYSITIWIKKGTEEERRITKNRAVIKNSGFKLNRIEPNLYDKALQDFIDKNKDVIRGEL